MKHYALVVRQLAAGIVAVALSGAALGQTTTNAVVTGEFAGVTANGYGEIGSFTCSGTPTCVGRFTEMIREIGCSNFLNRAGDFTITNLNLAQTGPIQGTVTIRAPEGTLVRNADGTCSVTPSGVVTISVPFIGAWNLATGTGAMSVPGEAGDGTPVQIAISFKADIGAPPPVFPMTVTSSITATAVSASAVLQYRAQDVGTTGNVYAFAVAPSTVVKAAMDGSPPFIVGKSLSATDGKDTPVACVLAQLSQSGQLIAVTAAQLQAYLSGVLSAQGASVSILNGVPTTSVAGATFYVGYGTSGTSMITNGIYRSAVTVPGNSTCTMFASQTALWWNPAESGWGLNLNHQGNILFGTLFTYDANRAPLWLVMSAGAMQPDGFTFLGDLYRTTGPAFNASPFTPIGAANLTLVGTMAVSFLDTNEAALRYTVNGEAVSKTIQRQVFGSRASSCLPTTASRASATNYQDLWWNEAESGWGINITHQDNTLFATLFTYDATGKGLWLVMSSGQRQADGAYTGDLFRTAGPVFSANPFTPIGANDVTKVGTMSLGFSNGNSGTLTYTYDGVPVTKSITRQVFSSTVPACS